MKLTTRSRRRAFIEGYEFPMALKNKLREELDADRPVNVALEGLRQWYLACLRRRPQGDRSACPRTRSTSRGTR